MKGTTRVAAMLLLSVLAAGCALEETGELPLELQEAVASFYDAVEAGDAEARIALFGEDAILMPNHWTRVQGREAIAEVIRSGEGWVFRLRDRTLVDSDVSGGLAYLANAYDYTWHAEGAEPQWHRTKNVHIWKRNAAGAWKLHLDIWNSDVPLDQFADEGLPADEGP